MRKRKDTFIARDKDGNLKSYKKFKPDKNAKGQKIIDTCSSILVVIGFFMAIFKVLIPAYNSAVAYKEDDIYRILRYVWAGFVLFVLILFVVLAIDSKLRNKKIVEEYVEQELIDKEKEK
ncbi:MAG: hypothetical protein R3Y60_05485 [bacterium]